MDLSFQYLLEGSFAPGSRVWVYQSNRSFSPAEASEIRNALKAFADNWKSHGDPVKAAGYLLFDQFIVLMADETQTGVGGCSTDSSVRFLKELEQEFQVRLFDRTNLAFVINDKVQTISLDEVDEALQKGTITPDTPYFNNVVLTKEELQSKWILPVKDSWLKRKLKLASS